MVRDARTGRPRRPPSRGDIHFVKFPDTGGHVIRGIHPAVVVQSNRLHGSSTVIVLPMTSSASAAAWDPPFLVSVAGPDCGLPRDGWIKCDQPMTLPTAILGPKAGRLNDDATRRLDAALRFVLAV